MNLYEDEGFRDFLRLKQAGDHSAEATEQSKKVERKLASISKALAEQNRRESKRESLPQCPICGGRLEGTFRKCPHCREDLAWVDNIPCEPGQEDSLRERLAEADEEREREAEWRRQQKRQDREYEKLQEERLRQQEEEYERALPTYYPPYYRSALLVTSVAVGALVLVRSSFFAAAYWSLATLFIVSLPIQVIVCLRTLRKQIAPAAKRLGQGVASLAMLYFFHQMYASAYRFYIETNGFYGNTGIIVAFVFATLGALFLSAVWLKFCRDILKRITFEEWKTELDLAK